jgi:hypothetical protein
LSSVPNTVASGRVRLHDGLGAAVTKLRRLGYHVLRVDAALLMREPEAAVALVRAAI